MNKAMMADALAARFGLSKNKSQQIVQYIFDGEEGLIATTLKAQTDVTIKGFGTFKLVTRAGRVATNPSNGTKVTVPSKVVPKFKAGKTLSDLVK